MSTRAILAVASGDRWHGVYVHSSGYPTCLGPELWTALRYARPAESSFDKSVFETTYILNHAQGWRSFPDCCYCHDEAGNRSADQEDVMLYTDADEDAEALFIQWVYVVSQNVITIFTNVPTGREQRIETQDGRWWMEPVHRWAQVTHVALNQAEPDWHMIETLGTHLHQQRHDHLPLQGA